MTFEKLVMEEALDAIIDYRGRTPQKSPIGIPTLSAKSVKNGQIDYSECYYISPEEYKKFMTRGFPQKGDILLTTEAPLGMVAKLDRADVAVAQRLLTLRGKKEVLDNDFLMYYLQSSEGQGLLKAKETGTTVTGIKQAEFRKIVIKVPDFQTQKKIAAILSALDEKIAINREINDNLEQQAFSVFDNLIANAENNDRTVSDYAFLNPKRTLAKNQVARSIDMSQLSTSGAFPSSWEMKPFNGGMRFTNGDTLLARITPCLENGKTAFIDFLDDGEVAFGSTEYIVLAPKNDTPPEMLYCLARYPAFVDYAVKNMNGSSGRQRVSAETVGQYRLPLFDKHSLVLFKEVVSPMFLKMRYNSLENMRLAELRDALLPKLMSGEVDVSDIQL